MQFKRIATSIVLFFFVILILYFSFPKIIYNFFIFPIIKDNQIYLFGDWTVILSAIKCKLINYDVFINNPCDVINRTHVYGSILLFIPYFQNLNIFYFLYFPIIVNLIFIAAIISHFRFLNIRDFILPLVFIFNPSTLLLMERLNFDIFIFLIMLLLCYFRKNFLNLFLVSFLTVAKFYPISLVLLFFIKDKSKKFLVNIIYFIFFLFLTIILLYLDRANISKIVNNVAQFSANYKWSFNFFGFSKIPFLLEIFSKDILVIFSIFLFLIFIFFGFNSPIFKIIEDNYLSDKKNWNYKETLFLISSGIFVSTYFVFNNWIYREVFLFGLIPLFLELSDISFFLKNLVNFIIFRFIYFTLSSFFTIFLNNDLLLTFNQIMDICFVSFIAGILVRLYLKLLINFFISRKFTL